VTVGAGEDYRSAGAAPPVALANNASVTPATYGAALQAAYSIAHDHGRCLARSCVGRINGRAAPAPLAYSSWATVPIARWWPRVPDEVSALIAVIDFGYAITGLGSRIEHRLIASAGGNTDTGSSYYSDPSDADIQARGVGPVWLSNPLRRRRVIARVDLSTVADAQRVSVVVQAQAGSESFLRHIQAALYWIANG